MRRKQLEPNTLAISTLVIALIIIIVAGLIATVVVAAVFLGLWKPFGQVVGSGIIETKNWDITGFTIVEVGWGFEVKVSQSDSFGTSIRADNNMFDYIEISQSGDILTIGLKWGYNYRNVTLKAEVTLPILSELEFSGGTHGIVEEFTSSYNFILELSGGSHFSGNFTTSANAQFTLSGGSHLIELEGAANYLTISGSGGSQLDLSHFPVHDANVNLDGGSQATINLDGRLSGDLSGCSHLKYLGSPTSVDVNTSGGSIVNPK